MSVEPPMQDLDALICQHCENEGMPILVVGYTQSDGIYPDIPHMRSKIGLPGGI